MVWARWLDGLGWDIFPFSDICPSTFSINLQVKWIWAISVLVARWIKSISGLGEVGLQTPSNSFQLPPTVTQIYK